MASASNRWARRFLGWGGLLSVRLQTTSGQAKLVFVALWSWHVTGLWRLFAHLTPPLNDDVLHSRLVNVVAEAWRGQVSVLDPWVSTITQGYPLFHHYQHIPHLVMGSWAALTQSPGLLMVRGGQLLGLAAFPWITRWTARGLGLGPTSGWAAGIATMLLATRGLFGLDLSSYDWGGPGLTTQLWGMLLLGPAWVTGWRAVEGRGSRVVAGALVGLLIVTHTVLGYVAAFSLAGGALLSHPRCWLGRLRAVVACGAVALGSTAYFLVPFWLDRDAMNRSVWESLEKYDGYGATWVLSKLVSGELFDGSSLTRFPLLTPLLFLGLGVAFFQLLRGGRRIGRDLLGRARVPVLRRGLWLRTRKDVDEYAARQTRGMPKGTLRVCRGSMGAATAQSVASPTGGIPGRPLAFLVALFFGWLALFFGRATWGNTVDLLPMARHLHFHRLIAPVHLSGLILVGFGLRTLWRWAHRAPMPPAIWLLVAVGLVAQPAWERQSWIGARRRWIDEAQAELARDDGRLAAVLQELKHLPPGRIYAGRAPNWGKQYRVGGVPVYAHLTRHGLDNLGYLYHALALSADIEGYVQEDNHAHFNLFNLRYLLAPKGIKPPPGAILHRRWGRHTLYRIPTNGFVELVDASKAYAGTRQQWFEAVRRWLLSPALRTRERPVLYVNRSAPKDAVPLAVWESNAKGLDLSDTPCGAVLEQSSQPGAYSAHVMAHRACYVMLKATYHPNWNIQVDGRVVAPSMLAPSFVGVPVAAGSHRVQFVYAPRPLKAVLFWLGLATLGVIGLWERRRSKKRWLVPPPRTDRGESRG